MKELVFKANDISTSDYGYIHFSTSTKGPCKEGIFLLLQKLGSKTRIIVVEYDIPATLNYNNFTLRLDSRHLFLSNLTYNIQDNPYKSITVLFDVDDEKLSEIKDRLNEAYPYQIQI